MLFLSPFQSPYWRPINSRFAQLEHRLARHRRWLEKETENQVQDFNEIELHRNRYVRQLYRQSESSGSGELEEDRMAKRVRRVEIVRDWISKTPQPVHSGENTIIEHLGSCNWFLEHAKYRAWKNRPFESRHANDPNALRNDWHDRVLFVQGRQFTYL